MTEAEDLHYCAVQWEKLAEEERNRHDYEVLIGRLVPHGSSPFLNRQQMYLRVAEALRLEAKTGKPHCHLCLKDHPPHLHPRDKK